MKALQRLASRLRLGRQRRLVTSGRTRASGAEPIEELRIVTYNVHKCRGLDGRISPRRILEVLLEIDADLIALQEVVIREGSAAEHDQARFLANELGLHLQIGANRTHRGGSYGNVVLSRFPLGSERNYDLSVKGRERRGCMRADVQLGPSRILHVFNLHLGTAAWERRRQGLKLIDDQIIENEDLAGPRVVLGDFNDWRRELTPRLLAARLDSIDIQSHLRRKRTYPGLLPLTHLDHIYFDARLELQNVVLHRTRKTVMASDHLPLAADFRLRAKAAPTLQGEQVSLETVAK